MKTTSSPPRAFFSLSSRRSWPAALGLFLLHTMPAPAANEIGFLEPFALAPDRAAPLQQLVPGTEDYYYFHALHRQHQGDRAGFTALLEPWARRFPNSPGRRELETRQALLDYETDPEGSLAFIKRRLDLRFDDQRDVPAEKPDLPATLDPALVADAAFLKLALQGSEDLALVGPRALAALIASQHPFTSAQRRAALARLDRPDVPRLVEFIAEDLATRESRGFGEFGIHRSLTLEQLQALQRLWPALTENEAFVSTTLGKLRPGADEDAVTDPAAREAFLDRAWAFVRTLGPSFTSLKANLLIVRLEHDRRRGVYDAARFLEYVKIPRHAPHVHPEWQKRDPRAWEHVATFDPSVAEALLPGLPIDEQALVRDHLLHFLATAASPADYAPYFEAQWLQAVFAEARLTRGVEDARQAEQLASALTPAAYEALKKRVDLDFAPGNPTRLQPADAVALDVWVKNIGEVTVKIFELNPAAYYEQTPRPIDTDIDLDGLVPALERRLDTAAAPLLRKKHSLALPELGAKRGVWVVELIGNGRSSRALLRKGGLTHLARSSAAGTAITVLDETHAPVKGSYATFAGRRFDVNEHGEILLPLTAQPGPQPVILHDSAGFAALEHVSLHGEAYAFDAAFHVEREALLTGAQATLALRPRLTLNDEPVAISLLEKPRLTLTSTDLHGIATTVAVADLKLADQREFLHSFKVPARLATLHVTLEGEIKSLTQGQPVPLQVEHMFFLNGIEDRPVVEDLHLVPSAEGWWIEQRGKNGELKPERALNVAFQHRDYQLPVEVTLKTNADGRLPLGALPGIESLTVSTAAGLSRTWTLPRERVTGSDTLHLAAGELLRVATFTPLAEISLLETRGGGEDPTYVKDWSAQLTGGDGFVEARDLPAGDYELHLKPEDRVLTVRVTKGQRVRNFLVSPSRLLELRPARALQVRPVTGEGGGIHAFQVVNAGPQTRVHVAFTRYLPGFALDEQLGELAIPAPLTGVPGVSESQYVSGRQLGDEYRYILERQTATVFPGVNLPRPGLLLNPWAVRDTTTGKQEAKEGEKFLRLNEPRVGSALRRATASPKKPAPPISAEIADPFGGVAPLQPSDTALDFLTAPAPVWFNLVPDENGVVSLPAAALAAAAQAGATRLNVLALDAETAVFRTFDAPVKPIPTRDLRLAEGLDPQHHFAQQDEVVVVAKDQTHTIPNALATKFEAYDHLGRVYALFRTLSGNDTLAEFAFLLDWPTFDEAKKRELYSQYASHELSFFLAEKDPAFFKKVVQPYLANKKDKTFLDDYLLEADLTRYLDSWRYHRLNTVERLLLARRLPEQRAAETRALNDAVALIPVNREEDRRRLETALLGRALQAGEGASDSLEKAREDLSLKADEANIRARSELQKFERAVPAAAPAEALDALPVPAAAQPLQAAGRVADAPSEYDDESLGWAAIDRDALLRQQQATAAFYRKLGVTKEWAENNYWKLPPAAQNADLITPNRFWQDFAAWDGVSPFLSTHVTDATRNFSEMVLALAVLDLPFPSEARDAGAKLDDTTLTLTPKTPLLLFQQAAQPADLDDTGAKLLVSQNFFRFDDRYEQRDGERIDKFVQGEFLAGVLYGAQVVVTNPTSSTQKLDVLFQIPRGAVPAAGAKATTNQALRLEPFHTHTFEVAFYFPTAGVFPQFPVHVARAGRIAAFAEAREFAVTDRLAAPDTASWAHVSQSGSEQDVLAFLDTANVRELDLTKLAWRLKDNADFFRALLEKLTTRRVYVPVLWRYAAWHNDAKALGDFLRHEGTLLAEAGPWLRSRLADIDPVERGLYEHLEYSPLVNARAHRLGAERTILNDQFREQYRKFLAVLAHKPALDAADRLALTGYLLLQDRIEEALAVFAEVKKADVATALQYDYTAAWLALAQGDTRAARTLAEARATEPVNRWREKFAALFAQVDEIEGRGPAVTDPENREQTQESLAATLPGFEFTLENGQVKLETRHLDAVTLNYYLMDLEFLFSTNPFVGQDSRRFAQIVPNRSETVKLPGTPVAAHATPLPRDFQNRNVLVEVVAGGQRKAQAVYANELAVTLSENYGQLQVRHAADQRPLGKVYVKVYALQNGRPVFYKDGYTDLRGKFDYASLSTDDLGGITRFALLVLSPEHGAVVKEAGVPRQ